MTESLGQAALAAGSTNYTAISIVASVMVPGLPAPACVSWHAFPFMEKESAFLTRKVR